MIKRSEEASLHSFLQGNFYLHHVWIFVKIKATIFRWWLLFGAAGEIRTLGTLLAYTRFPVVLVMTASILLRIGALDSKNDYTKNHSKVKHKFEKCAIF